MPITNEVVLFFAVIRFCLVDGGVVKSITTSESENIFSALLLTLWLVFKPSSVDKFLFKSLWSKCSKPPEKLTDFLLEIVFETVIFYAWKVSFLIT